ncbi:MAG: acylphosphatase [Candidatus Harrisonbacteria bacterium CG10_big_fil_rev_8_21_14_0_10_40_38]|uniref:acylphosphatase n=1 Tax=Candidatus Harrisonbacteria bacterium CG10_big_fil_rev_8_21_14_0_10_40_38 TaxID=1974583 RepID=A0A2H0UU60_9BACT|nr:MAG: acylphosphatase [Candidatus Harrisonbacteria bacterium CG10_big_fil_rev_8_21_14_0_10_40_38]
MFKHLNITIYGKVQGIFFRRTVKHEADKIGIFGFIRNEPDTTVYIEVEGKEDELNQFTAWLKSGAGEGEHEISLVDVETGPYKAFNTFEIKDDK